MTSSCPCQKSPLKTAPSTQTCRPLATCRFQVPSVLSVNPSQHLNRAPDWSVRTHQSPRRFHALRLSSSYLSSSHSSRVERVSSRRVRPAGWPYPISYKALIKSPAVYTIPSPASCFIGSAQRFHVPVSTLIGSWRGLPGARIISLGFVPRLHERQVNLFIKFLPN